MAKSKSILKLSGTIGGITFVNSKAYGSHTPIALADGMKASSLLQKQANLMAKLVFDELKSFAPGFKDGKLWVRLLQVFRAVANNGAPYSYGPLHGFQLRPDYPSTRFGDLHIGFMLADGQAMPTLTFQKLGKPIEGFRISLKQLVAEEGLQSAIAVKDAVIDPMDDTDLSDLSADEAQWAHTVYFAHLERLENGRSSGLLKNSAVVILTGKLGAGINSKIKRQKFLI